MKFKRILTLALSILLLTSASYAEFFEDIIVTSPDGIWTDARAYSTLNAAITAVSTDERTVTITSPQTVTALTVPSNVTLKFERNGAINNSGQLTINTKNIIAPNRQIFTGAGDIDFVNGSEVKTGWFADLDEAIDVTSDDSITLIVSEQDYITSSIAVGDDVFLKWESPNNQIVASAGATLSNIHDISAGHYQLFAGAGDFDFDDRTELRLSWFSRLSSAIYFIGTVKSTLVIDEAITMNENVSIPSTLTVEVLPGATITTTGWKLTIAGGPGSIIASSRQQIFAGTGSVLFTLGGTVYPEWFGGVADCDGTTGTDNYLPTLYAFNSIKTKGGVIFFNPGDYYFGTGLRRQTIDAVNSSRGLTVVIEGGGKLDTHLYHGSNDKLFSFKNQHTDTFSNVIIRNMQIRAIGDAASGSSAKAIEYADSWKYEISNCIIRDYSTVGAEAVRIVNDDFFTEGTIIDNVDFRENYTDIRFSREADNNVAYSSFTQTYINTTHKPAANGLGIYISAADGSRPCHVYQSRITAFCWLSNTGTNLISINHGGSIQRSEVHVGKDGASQGDSSDYHLIKVNTTNGATFTENVGTTRLGNISLLSYKDGSGNDRTFNNLIRPRDLVADNGGKPFAEMRGAGFKVGEEDNTSNITWNPGVLPPFSSFIVNISVEGTSHIFNASYVVTTYNSVTVSSVDLISGKDDVDFYVRPISGLEPHSTSSGNGQQIEVIMNSSTAGVETDWTAEIIMQ